VLFLCSGFGLGFRRKHQAKRRLWAGERKFAAFAYAIEK
jgi:hypothetical protein